MTGFQFAQALVRGCGGEAQTMLAHRMQLLSMRVEPAQFPSAIPISVQSLPLYSTAVLLLLSYVVVHAWSMSAVPKALALTGAWLLLPTDALLGRTRTRPPGTAACGRQAGSSTRLSLPAAHLASVNGWQLVGCLIEIEDMAIW